MGRQVCVLGIVKDFRAPIATGRTDHKCTVTLYDESTEEDNDGVNVNIFRPEKEMPHFNAGDIVMVLMVKVQKWNGSLSLLTNFNTDIHVYDGSKIPKPPKSAFAALREPRGRVKREPNAKEHEYVSWMYQQVDKGYIPDETLFQARTEQSLNVKEKFTLLKDVKDGKFADIIVQVVKEPYDLGDKMTLWVTDYTENPAFFHKTYDGVDDLVARERDGDPYGYTKKFNAKTAKSVSPDLSQQWNGPFGKKTMQVTCWEPHASFIRSNIQMSEWVRLRNVQIKFGHNSANIEGFLREDRTFMGKMLVDILDPADDAEMIDPRFKEAIRRKRDYEREKKTQLKGIVAEVTQAKKRKAPLQEAEEAADSEPDRKRGKLNSRSRRKAKRAALEKKEEKEKQDPALDVSELILCEYPNQEITPLSQILAPIFYNTRIDDEDVKIQMPFTNAKYRTHVRVVDFHPPNLEDFAVVKKKGEYDVLSDNSGDSSDDSDVEIPNKFTSGSWEWRFALKLEDATAKLKPQQRKTFWVVVNNVQAQLLTNLDAKNLRADPENLETLRETLFKLWGDLEERKRAVEEARNGKLRGRKQLPGERPPLDSSDGEGNGGGKEPTLSQTSNKPFTCCLQQYGIKVKARNAQEANAGENWKWERVFSLFGTKIRSD